MYLGLEVVQVEYANFSDRLRIQGVIREAPDDVSHGAHHTFNVEVGDDVKVTKGRWRRYELDRIEEAVRATQRPHVLILCIDDDTAVLSAVRQSGVELLCEVPGPGTQKGHDRPPKGAKEAWFQELLEELERSGAGQLPMVLVGPGFTRTELLKYVRDRAPGLVASASSEGTGQSGMVGVREAIRRGVVSRVVEGARVDMETSLVESALAGIGRGDGTVTYGIAAVRAAVSAGAAEDVLVTDDVVREGPVVELLDLAEQMGARVVVVSTAHDAGERLSNLGGLAALHRYPFEPPR